MINDIDYLTGLFNFFYLKENYHKYINNREQCYLIVVDLKQLKYINDNFGHEAGDKSIVAFTSSLSNLFSDSLFIRRSGDEFVIVTDLEYSDIIDNFKEVIENLKNKQEAGLIPLAFAFNCGIKKVEKDLTDTLYKADLTMYEAKNNNVLYKSYREEFLKEEKEKENFLKEIDKLIKTKGINYVIQKVYNINGKTPLIGQIYSRDKNGESIFTDDKFKILKVNYKIKHIDILNLQELIKKVLPKRDKKIKYMINVYYSTLFSKENKTFNLLRQLKEENHYDFQNIILNIKVLEYQNSIYKLVTIIRDLKELGFLICLDCISSDEADVILPIIAILKIDYVIISKKSLIKGMNENKYNKVLKKITELLLELEIIPIFINVENDNEVDYINQISDKCLIRGYFYGKEESIKK